MARRRRLVHKGIRHDRTEVTDGTGRREKDFATAWWRENKSRQYGSFSYCSRLEWIMRSDQENIFVPVTQDVATAVATVIQWFGSSVGFSVLEEILGEAGYKIVPSKKRKPLVAKRLKME